MSDYGNDSLFDLAGTNSFVGGAGNDFVFAGSADGAQTINAGDGNDTILLLGRTFASSITTGAGSDVVELLNADAGTETITVTDFTAGAGGDQFVLSSAEGSLGSRRAATGIGTWRLLPAGARAARRRPERPVRAVRARS